MSISLDPHYIKIEVSVGEVRALGDRPQDVAVHHALLLLLLWDNKAARLSLSY
jgi:hypothetical protein